MGRQSGHDKQLSDWDSRLEAFAGPHADVRRSETLALEENGILFEDVTDDEVADDLLQIRVTWRRHQFCGLALAFPDGVQLRGVCPEFPPSQYDYHEGFLCKES